ncbi:MAG TPA: PAS domain S-box protein, partial [Candidatus Limnocylindrales bacterium]|nr:PAS domain S-box protein [Candidatus Limnocylindrales bacterium]
MASPGGRSGVVDARILCRSLIDAVNDVILVIDRQSLRILDANKRAIEVYGYPREELIGRSLRDLTHAEPAPFRFRGKVPDQNFEETHFSSTGERLDFLVNLSELEYWGRNAVVSINRDIRDRKRAELALAASEKRQRLLLQNISEMVATIDATGRIRFIGPQVEHVLGYAPADVLGRDIFDFIHPDDQERARAEYSSTVLEPGEAAPSVLRLKDQAGNWVAFEVIANNQLHDPDVAGIIATARDLRFRRDAQQAIHRASLGLDTNIDEHTLELARANAALRVENHQRRFT